MVRVTILQRARVNSEWITRTINNDFVDMESAQQHLASRRRKPSFGMREDLEITITEIETD